MWFAVRQAGRKSEGARVVPGDGTWSPKRAKRRPTKPITCCRVNNLIQKNEAKTNRKRTQNEAKTKPYRSQSHRLFIINKMGDFANPSAVKLQFACHPECYMDLRPTNRGERPPLHVIPSGSEGSRFELLVPEPKQDPSLPLGMT